MQRELHVRDEYLVLEQGLVRHSQVPQLDLAAKERAARQHAAVQLAPFDRVDKREVGGECAKRVDAHRVVGRETRARNVVGVGGKSSRVDAEQSDRAVCVSERNVGGCAQLAPVAARALSEREDQAEQDLPARLVRYRLRSARMTIGWLLDAEDVAVAVRTSGQEVADEALVGHRLAPEVGSPLQTADVADAFVEE